MRIPMFAAACLAMALVCAPAQDQPSNVQALVNEALTAFSEKHYDAALAKLTEAEKLSPNDAFLLNLIGAAYAKKKDYDAAKSFFDRALSVNPSFFPALFNVGEMYFLKAQYPQALDYFVKMLDDDRNNELLQFKVIMSLIQTKQIDEARAMAERMKFPGDGPAWYFAHAAVELASKNKRKAIGYINSAELIFPDKTSLFRESFEDLNWPTK